MIIKKRFLFFMLFGILIVFNSSDIFARTLGITPAFLDTGFVPGGKLLVNFQVLGADPDQNLSVYADGDFAEYVHFDKDSFFGSQGFSAYIDLPEVAKKPGKNNLYIRVLEKESSKTGGVSAKLSIGVLIRIKVPYPGQYAEINSFDVNDANYGDQINLALTVESLGNQSIFARPSIEINSQKEIIDNVIFQEKEIQNQTLWTFEKTLEGKYDPGDYNAIAFVKYGDSLNPTSINMTKKLRIGTLFVGIVNWSSEFNNTKINDFYIAIESKWNNPIQNVYGEVRVTSINGTLVDIFKTPSINLYPWEKNQLKGFFNAENIKAGHYYANIKVFYSDKISEKDVEINVATPKVKGDFLSTLMSPEFLLITVVVLICLVIFIIIILMAVIIHLLKRERNSHVKS